MFKKIRCTISSLFVERRIVITSDNNLKTIRFSALNQMIICVVIMALLLGLAIFSAYTYIREERISVVYEEMDTLKSVNSSLVQHIDSINAEIADFADYFHRHDKERDNVKSSSKSLVKTCLSGRDSDKYELIANDLKQESLKNLSTMFNGINSHASYIIRVIEESGLSVDSMLKNNDPAIHKVKKSFVSNGQADDSVYVYNKNKNNYYVRSYFVEDMPETLLKNENTCKETQSKIKNILELESIYSDMPLNSPLSGFRVTSRYGKRIDPFTGAIRTHAGVDLHGGQGAPVYSSGSGKILFAGHSNSYGYMVDIDHGHGITTKYAHLKKTLVKTGDTITAGTQIGIQGNTGTRCKGEHLHYEVHYKNTTINPSKFIYAGQNISKEATARN